MEVGAEVGRLARELFPGGVLIEEDHLQLEAALISTRAVLDAGASTLYEAAFLYEDIQIRVDILHQVAEGVYDLIEVKSSSKPKDEHFHDLAIQLYVLEGVGVTIRTAWLMHLDTSYVWPGGAYNLEQLFKLTDLTHEVRSMQAVLSENLDSFRSMLIPEQIPEVQTGKHCKSPDYCAFHTYCHQYEPEHPVSYLPNARESLLTQFYQAGIQDVRAIPLDFPKLSLQYQRIVQAVKTGEPWFSLDLASAFTDLVYPLCFIDFESINPALPIFPNSRPYQQLTFQWSAHILEADGTLHHHEYLHDDRTDPREPFTQSLISLLHGKGSVIVYSSFEKTQLNALKEALPAYADAIEDMIQRLFDLHPVIKAHCYHPDFRGSFSIKKVLPALVPDLSYEGLAIGDGVAAAQSYLEMLGNCSEDRMQEIRQALLTYCGQDTLAMVKLFQELKKSYR